MIPGLHRACVDCAAGYVIGGALGWQICRTCDGLSRVFIAGAPRFGAVWCLGDRNPGEVVELATGHRGRILWHMPRPNPRSGAVAETTFLALLDDFDDHEAISPVPFPSSVGVLGSWPPSDVFTSAIVRPPDDDGAGAKGGDQLDVFIVRAGAGPLL